MMQSGCAVNRKSDLFFFFLPIINEQQNTLSLKKYKK